MPGKDSSVDFTNYDNTVLAKRPNDYQTFKRENQRSFNPFQRSNSSSGPIYRSPTPKLDEVRKPPYSETTQHRPTQDSTSNANSNKGGSDSYYTDKHYSKDFLSSSKPLSEMIIKRN